MNVGIMRTSSPVLVCTLRRLPRRSQSCLWIVQECFESLRVNSSTNTATLRCMLAFSVSALAASLVSTVPSRRFSLAIQQRHEVTTYPSYRRKTYLAFCETDEEALLNCCATIVVQSLPYMSASVETRSNRSWDFSRRRLV